jgi:CDP-diacylglycerol--glycerol-3-phosphate 3-phosphatidyltransferase
VIKEKFGAPLDRAVRALLPSGLVRHLSPNALTVLGAVVSLAAAFAFAEGSLRLGGALILAGGFFDLIDGAVARETGRSSTFGAFLDSTLDRLSDLAVLLGISLHYAGAGAGAVAAVAGWALVASALVSYAKARAESVIRLDAGFLERGERAGILALGALLGALPWALALVALGATVTVAQRIALAHREMAKLDAAGAARVSEGQTP